ncbi:MAG: hypothetical protein L6R45_15655 [Anaerolineae bacterium]|nr:hypothetical protein [Anaerolineae bacterium]
MALAAWWGRDPLPSLSSLASFSAGPTSDEPTLAHLNGLSLAEIRSRLQAGHRPIWPIYAEPGLDDLAGRGRLAGAGCGGSVAGPVMKVMSYLCEVMGDTANIRRISRIRFTWLRWVAITNSLTNWLSSGNRFSPSC